MLVIMKNNKTATQHIVCDCVCLWPSDFVFRRWL